MARQHDRRPAKFSVIIPVLNGQERIERAICSVLDQGCDDAELIVIDGGSTDGTIDIIRSYEDDLTFWMTGPDMGVPDAINKGLSKATGEYVAVLHADGLLLPGALEAVANAFAARDERGRATNWIIGRCARVDDNDTLVRFDAPSLPATLASFLMHDTGLLPLTASFFRRQVFDRVGLFDANLTLAYDYEMACRLLARKIEPTLIPQAVTTRRERTEAGLRIENLRRGQEFIAASWRYGDHLSLADRCALWVNCDIRSRIYAMAQAESRGGEAKRHLWHELIKHPWWLADDSVRRALRQTKNAPAATRTRGYRKAA